MLCILILDACSLLTTEWQCIYMSVCVCADDEFKISRAGTYQKRKRQAVGTSPQGLMLI